MITKKNSIRNHFIVILIMAVSVSFAQIETVTVDSFNKVIVSPHIQVTFQQGSSENVVIENSTVSRDKINIEVNGKTLRVYLDGAKEVTKTEESYENGYKRKKSIYKGTVVTAVITYKDLEELSLRGEETIICKSPLEGAQFRLKIFGESQVYLNKVDLDNLHTTIYGESYLELKEGQVGRQKITAYGETTINTLGVQTESAKVVAYGEGSYRLNVQEDLKVTAYGEATVAYEGSPKVNKGIIIGEASIQQIR